MYINYISVYRWQKSVNIWTFQKVTYSLCPDETAPLHLQFLFFFQNVVSHMHLTSRLPLACCGANPSANQWPKRRNRQCSARSLKGVNRCCYVFFMSFHETTFKGTNRVAQVESGRTLVDYMRRCVVSPLATSTSLLRRFRLLRRGKNVQTPSHLSLPSLYLHEPSHELTNSRADGSFSRGQRSDRDPPARRATARR